MQSDLTTEISSELPSAGGAPAAPFMVRRSPRVSLPNWLRLFLSNRKAALGLAILAFFVLVAIVGPLIWRGDPTAADYTIQPQQPPSATHWLGTDQQSHDIFLEMVDGTRPALILGFSIGTLATAIAVLIGMGAGYAGGWIDEVLMFFTNVVLVTPSLPLIIALASFVQVKNDIPIVLIISLTGWAWGARVLRSQTLAMRKKDFIQAAVVRGEPWWRIVLHDILPNMTSLVMSGFIGTTIFAIGSAAGLVFLGYGNLAETSWFTILYWAQNSNAVQDGAWWLFLPPGLAIGLVGVACALINYGIDEVSNPRLRVDKVKAVRRTLSPPPPDAAKGAAS